jgi:hypothetical protein
MRRRRIACLVEVQSTLLRRAVEECERAFYEAFVHKVSSSKRSKTTVLGERLREASQERTSRRASRRESRSPTQRRPSSPQPTPKASPPTHATPSVASQPTLYGLYADATAEASSTAWVAPVLLEDDTAAARDHVPPEGPVDVASSAESGDADNGGAAAEASAEQLNRRRRRTSRTKYADEPDTESPVNLRQAPTTLDTPPATPFSGYLSAEELAIESLTNARRTPTTLHGSHEPPSAPGTPFADFL